MAENKEDRCTREEIIEVIFRWLYMPVFRQL